MDSRLERGARALAWLALAATVAMLLGMGVWLRPLLNTSDDAQRIQLDRVSTASAPSDLMEDQNR